MVQLYSDDVLLLDTICRFIGGAIAVGDTGALSLPQSRTMMAWRRA